MATDQQTTQLAARFSEHPETISGDVSAEFVDFVLRVHPDQPYDSATAALMCRQAYDLGRRGGSQVSDPVHQSAEVSLEFSAQQFADALEAAFIAGFDAGQRRKSEERLTAWTEYLTKGIANG